MDSGTQVEGGSYIPHTWLLHMASAFDKSPFVALCIQKSPSMMSVCGSFLLWNESSLPVQELRKLYTPAEGSQTKWGFKKTQTILYSFRTSIHITE